MKDVKPEDALVDERGKGKLRLGVKDLFRIVGLQNFAFVRIKGKLFGQLIIGIDQLAPEINRHLRLQNRIRKKLSPHNNNKSKDFEKMLTPNIKGRRE